MGTWGPGVFDDDLACTIRESYRDLLAEGHSASDARNIILRQWVPYLDDPDSGPAIWLALAVTQWKLGRLDDHTKGRALALIANGGASRLWEGDTLLKKRVAVLAKVRNQLMAPQPPERKVRKRFRDFCDWEVGELIRYQTLSGRYVIFRVIGHHTDDGGTSPIVEVLDWIGDAVPPSAELMNLPIRKTTVPFGSEPVTQLFLGRTSERQLPQDRVQRLGIQLQPTQTPGGFLGGSWKFLDRELAGLFQIE